MQVVALYTCRCSHNAQTEPKRDAFVKKALTEHSNRLGVASQQPVIAW
jgi:hypothetical protein